jgi:hypothetical protein
MSMDVTAKSDFSNTGKLSEEMRILNGIYLLQLGLKTFNLSLSCRTFVIWWLRWLALRPRTSLWSICIM